MTSSNYQQKGKSPGNEVARRGVSVNVRFGEGWVGGQFTLIPKTHQKQFAVSARVHFLTFSSYNTV